MKKEFKQMNYVPLSEIQTTDSIMNQDKLLISKWNEIAGTFKSKTVIWDAVARSFLEWEKTNADSVLQAPYLSANQLTANNLSVISGLYIRPELLANQISTCLLYDSDKNNLVLSNKDGTISSFISRDTIIGDILKDGILSAVVMSPDEKYLIFIFRTKDASGHYQQCSVPLSALQYMYKYTDGLKTLSSGLSDSQPSVVIDYDSLYAKLSSNVGSVLVIPQLSAGKLSVNGRDMTTHLQALSSEISNATSCLCAVIQSVSSYLSSNLSCKVKVKQLSCGELSTVEQVADEFCLSSWKAGDVVIIRRGISLSSTRTQDTSYIYQGETSAWQAMDSSYGADSIYLAEDMVITEPFGKYEVGDSGSVRLSCSGMSVQAFLSSALTHVRHSPYSLPVASYTEVRDIGDMTSEVGTWATGLPSYSFAYIDDGYWTAYNKDESGNDSRAGNAVRLSGVILYRAGLLDEDAGDPDHNVFHLSAVNKVISSDQPGDLEVGDLLTIPSIDSSEVSVQYTDEARDIASYSGTAAYTESTVVPKNNLGEPDLSNVIPAGSFTGFTATIKIPEGRRRRFWYVGQDYTSPLDNAFFRNLATDANSDFNVELKTYSLEIPEETQRIVFTYLNDTDKPATLAQVTDVDGLGLDIKSQFKDPVVVSIEGANGYASKKYTVFEFVNENGIKATRFNITIS